MEGYMSTIKIKIKKPKQRFPVPQKPPKIQDSKKVYKRKPKHKKQEE